MTPAASVDEYLAAVPSNEARQILFRLRELIREEAPEAEEVISYGMPGYQLKKPFIWFGGFKNHCSLFAGSTTAQFADELKAFKISKGTIQFRLGNPLPEELIRRIVRARLADVLDLSAG